MFCVAAALRHGGLSLEALARHDDPETSALAERVEVVPDPGRPRLAARLEVETADGRLLRGELRPDEATYAWDAETVEAWALDVGGEAGEPGTRAVERVIAAVRDLESSGAGALARATVLSS